MQKPTDRLAGTSKGCAAESESSTGCTRSGGARRAGDRAPDFRLPDDDGRLVSLSRTLKTGPAVLAFLGESERLDLGIQLQALTDHSAQIAQFGASVLAISPIAPMRPQPSRSFNLLHDAGSAVANAYGLCPSLAGGLHHHFPESSVQPDDERRTAEHSHGSIPAAFVVNQAATIIMSLTDATFCSDFVPDNVVCTLAAVRQRKNRTQ